MAKTGKEKLAEKVKAAKEEKQRKKFLGPAFGLKIRLR